jgi:hypothetical protein
MKRAMMPFGLVAAVLLIGACTDPNPHYHGCPDYPDCTQNPCGGTCTPNPICNADDQCAAGQVCTTEGCASQCSTHADCDRGKMCVTGYCVGKQVPEVKPVDPPIPSTCTKDEECGDEHYCSENKCVERCKSDDDCSGGLVCVACGKCQPPETPATCGEVPDYCDEKRPCGAGKSCEVGRCHYSCDAKTSCPVGQTCQSGVCKDDPMPTSPECVLDLNCKSGSCINGYCHAFCEKSNECGFGMLCQVGICQPDYFPAK